MKAKLLKILTSDFDRGHAEFRRKWFELLRFPSVGSEPEHERESVACAQWLLVELESMGFEAELLETTGRPLVFAVREADRQGAPTALFYGHYDVQSADPLELWDQPDPYEAVERGGRVYARGAQDNKGQLFFALQSVRALIAAGVPLPRIKIVLEGEEECGSLGIAEFLKTSGERFEADYLLVGDTCVAEDGRPSVIAGLRGVVALNLRLTGASHDLHSGQHGGLAPNAAMAMARLLSTLHDEQGRILVDGFMDGLIEPTPEELAAACDTPFDAQGYFAETGAQPVGGETELAPQVRTGFRPTIEVNGLHSGYSGSGRKTIIPAMAEAKLSMRLCHGQDSATCLAAVERHLEAHCPAGMKLEMEGYDGGLPALRLAMDSPIMKMAREIMNDMDPRGSVLRWGGASIPIVTALQEASGAQPLLVGFGREEDRIHAPNESYSWEQARQMYTFYGQLFARLGSQD